MAGRKFDVEGMPPGIFRRIELRNIKGNKAEARYVVRLVDQTGYAGRLCLFTHSELARLNEAKLDFPLPKKAPGWIQFAYSVRGHWNCVVLLAAPDSTEDLPVKFAGHSFRPGAPIDDRFVITHITQDMMRRVTRRARQFRERIVAALAEKE